jgi:hypothetical protein
MEEIKTVDDLIKVKRLTAEEQEKLRDIIEECRMRETQIREASESAKRNIEALSVTFDKVIETISTVGKAVDKLHEEIGRLQLKMMPEEQFFRA